MLGLPWRQKPPVGTPIGASSSLATGLAALVPLWEGSGLPVDVASRTPARSNSMTWVAGPYGWCLAGNGTNQWADVVDDIALSVAGPITVAACCAPAVGAVNQHVIDCRDTASGYILGFDLYGNNEINWYLPSTATNANSSANAVDGGWHVFAVSQSSTAAGGIQFYRDGQTWGTARQTGLPGTPGSSATRRIGTNNGASGAWFKGPIGWIAVWSRALTAVEHAALAANPWQIFRPQVGALRLSASTSGPRASYSRGGSALRPVHLSVAEFLCYLD